MFHYGTFGSKFDFLYIVHKTIINWSYIHIYMYIYICIDIYIYEDKLGNGNIYI